ncbi:MAG: glycosyl hydrolase 2 galactose-binding domain-containing protein [Janthinobacterium lividum]
MQYLTGNCRPCWLLLFALVTWGKLPACAQTAKLNYGLTQPQDPATLPQAKAPFAAPTRRAKVRPRTVLAAAPDGQFRLTQGWELAAANQVPAAGAAISRPAFSSAAWYNATVPGTVLTTLIDQGVYPDPYVGLNNLRIPDTLARQPWWYRIRFRVPAEKRGQSAWLTFEGINYQAEVWLNGQRLGGIKGAFRRGEFDISHQLNPTGDNVLAVRILPPPHPGIPHEESSQTGQGPNGGRLASDGPTFMAAEGWDWMPGIRDRNCGIWQEVRLHFSGPVTLRDPQVITDLPLPDTTRAAVTIRALLHNSSRQPQTVSVTGQLEGQTFRQTVTVPAQRDQVVVFDPANFAPLRLPKPRLWWPNGYGHPALYRVRLTVATAAHKLSDQQTVRFGVRELSYEMTVDFPGETGKRVEFNPLQAPAGQLLFDNVSRREVAPDVVVARLRAGADQRAFTAVAAPAAAPYLVLKVNGQRIFCRGGNWGLDDARKRVDRARLEPYFKLHQQANLNMIRNWTGESTEEAFYALADEYGLLVWNDFWLSTEGYNVEPTDAALFLANATDVVRRYRNHPSIALWCPRNEGYAPAALEDPLARLIATDDGTRYYQPNSRNLNLRTSGPWNYFTDPAEYFRQYAHGFTTEIGTFSVPEAATIQQFIPQPDQWPISDTWYYHDLHAEHAQKAYLGDVTRLYGAPTSLPDFARKVQFLNYDHHRAMFEAWNSHLWHDASGVLLWMSHPAWPSMIWQLYTTDYATHAAYYGAQKACEPLHVQWNLDDHQVVVVNTTLQPLTSGRVTCAVYDVAGHALATETRAVQALPNQLATVGTPQLPAPPPPVYLVRLTLTDSAGKTLSTNEYWQKSTAEGNFQAFNSLPPVRLEQRLLRQDAATHTLTYELVNPAATPAVAIQLTLQNDQQQPVLPAYFSDGYFTLLPGERKVITVQCHNGIDTKTLRLLAKGYNSR